MILGIYQEGLAECIANEDGERQIACAVAFHGEEIVRYFYPAYCILIERNLISTLAIKPPTNSSKTLRTRLRVFVIYSAKSVFFYFLTSSSILWFRFVVDLSLCFPSLSTHFVLPDSRKFLRINQVRQRPLFSTPRLRTRRPIASKFFNPHLPHSRRLTTLPHITPLPHHTPQPHGPSLRLPSAS